MDLNSRTSEAIPRQAYYESGHQVPLQDLSSCRGDPMSIVKNLQQQSCQIQETKQEIKISPKRRKSGEKNVVEVVSSPVDYFPGRIPPPAHSSANQQQNGSYFDFDRWNLPPPTKIFGPQSIHQQHQSLMVPHPPPPIPYFPPFLTPHPTSDFTELNPLNNNPYNEHGSQPQYHQLNEQHSQQQQQEEHPKVVVPNIEEELNFLSEASASMGHGQNSGLVINKDGSSGPGHGFMNSYLKFLQGERDSSPPPITRKRQNWGRNNNKIEYKQMSFTSNNMNNTNNNTNANGVRTYYQSTSQRLTQQGDPQDDPRYFPLPKERKSDNFDSSDDGVSSEEDLFIKKVAAISMPVKSATVEKKPGKKGRPLKPGGPTERKRARLALLQQQMAQMKDGKEIHFESNINLVLNILIYRATATKKRSKQTRSKRKSEPETYVQR